MPTLKYEGTLPAVEVVGYGHFAPGDEKAVDEKTALDFDCDPCKAEGWVVTDDRDSSKRKRTADTATDDAPATDKSPRGPRVQRNNDE